jgi:hypothetical protein
MIVRNILLFVCHPHLYRQSKGVEYNVVVVFVVVCSRGLESSNNAYKRFVIFRGVKAPPKKIVAIPKGFGESE